MMSMRYRTGSRDQVIHQMARFAIQDRQGFLEAIEGCHSESDDEARRRAEDCIADFSRIAQQVKPSR